jgi:hypothetical protein
MVKQQSISGFASNNYLGVRRDVGLAAGLRRQLPFFKAKRSTNADPERIPLPRLAFLSIKWTQTYCSGETLILPRLLQEPLAIAATTRYYLTQYRYSFPLTQGTLPLIKKVRCSGPPGQCDRCVRHNVACETSRRVRRYIGLIQVS